MKKEVQWLIFILVLLLSLVSCQSKTGTSDIGGSGSIGGNDENNQEIDNKENLDVEEKITAMFITIYNHKLEVALEDNASVKALIEVLQKTDITYTVNDYGGFEKVGDIGYTLPQVNTNITTQAGDVILYQGHNICLYYGINSWNFTRLGKIIGYEASELSVLLGAGKGSTQVTISLK